MSEVPYFLWSDDDQVTEEQLRSLLASSDPQVRALWAARVMREARYDDVWQFLTLEAVVRDWPLIERHLGRARPFWDWLLRGWREEGALPDV